MQELLEFRRQRPAMRCVVEHMPRHLDVGRPVWLRVAENTRIQGEDQMRRVLAFEHGVPATR